MQKQTQTHILTCTQVKQTQTHIHVAMVKQTQTHIHTHTQVIAIGLNTVREICSRQPLAMDKVLLEDLTQYKKHKDKGVVMAARSLISLFRTVDSDMLKKRDRGRTGEDNDKKRHLFGEEKISTGVEGLELLDLPTDSEDDDSDETDEEEVCVCVCVYVCA